MDNQKNKSPEFNYKAYRDNIVKIIDNAPHTKEGALIQDRNEYLKTLPKDEHGFPIINQEEFDVMAIEFDWEIDFIQDYLYEEGMICAWDYDEFYQITD